MKNTKAILIFLAIAFGLAWILFTLPLLLAEPGTKEYQTTVLLAWSAAMWAPGLGAILATKLSGGKMKSLRLSTLGDRKAYLWAWAVPILLSLLTFLTTYVLGLGKLDLTFSLLRQAMAQSPQNINPAAIATLQIAAALTVAPFFNTLFAIGEELGWRGFLLPRLLPLGQWKAMLLSGVIWGVWHAPAILQGHNYPSQPVLGVLFMIIFTVLAGIFLGWLYLRTRSPWAPAFAHGVLNAVAGLPILFFTDLDITYGGTLASLASWIPWTLLVVYLIASKRLPVRNIGDEGELTGIETTVSRETEMA